MLDGPPLVSLAYQAQEYIKSVPSVAFARLCSVGWLDLQAVSEHEGQLGVPRLSLRHSAHPLGLPFPSRMSLNVDILFCGLGYHILMFSQFT